MAAVRKKFCQHAFLTNSKIKNFDLSVVEAIEECIKNIGTKFQINRFIRT